MSDPILIGPTPPSRTELRELQEFIASIHGSPIEAERRLERRIAELVRRPHAVLFSSLGTAIEASLEALAASEGAEIVAPALAPIALAAAAHRVRARILYADIDPRTMNLSGVEAAARLSPSTRVVVGCANLGQPAGLGELAALASRNEIPMLEIVAGGLGGQLGRDPVGRFGRIAVVSLGERDSTVGSGGAVCVTNDDSLAHALRLGRNLGTLDPRQEWERIGGVPRVERIGLDARLGLLPSGLGLLRLSRFDETCEELERIFHSYLRRLALHPDLVLPAPCADGTVRWSHFAVRLGERYGRDDRDSIIQGMLRHDLAATAPLVALPLEPAFAQFHSIGDFPCAERAADRLIALPFSTRLAERDIDLICQTLQVMIERQSIMRS
jgi:dTDP-4-amino-4,6-dideoxygalactose transaminase